MSCYDFRCHENISVAFDDRSKLSGNHGYLRRMIRQAVQNFAREVALPFEARHSETVCRHVDRALSHHLELGGEMVGKASVGCPFEGRWKERRNKATGQRGSGKAALHAEMLQ